MRIPTWMRLGLRKRFSKKFKIHPSSIKFQEIDEMPLTSNGKVNYKKLLETYGV